MTGRGKRRKKKDLNPTGVYAATAEVDEGQVHASESIATSNQQTTGNVPIGNVPSCPTSSAYILRPKFSGKEWPVFEVIFETHLRKLNLKHVLTDINPDSELNTQVYDELILCLDHESIKAICHTAVNDGQAAWKILKEKYLGDKRQRKTNAINAIANIQIKPNESIEAAITEIEGHKKILDQHKLCDESVLVGLFVKALPTGYNTFKVISSHGGYPPWNEFKTQLRNFVSNSFNNEPTNRSSVMSLNTSQQPYIQKSRNRRKDYWKKKIKYCDICDMTSHTKQECWHNQQNTRNQRPPYRGRPGQDIYRGRGGAAPRKQDQTINTAATAATYGRGRGTRSRRRRNGAARGRSGDAGRGRAANPVDRRYNDNEENDQRLQGDHYNNAYSPANENYQQNYS